MFTCPAKHASETPEFCSVCGLEIPPRRAGRSAAGVRRRRPARACRAIRRRPGVHRARRWRGLSRLRRSRDNDRQVFCEVCGYNFVNRVAGSGPPPPYVPPSAANGPPTEWVAAPVQDPARSSVEGLSSAPVPVSAPLPANVPVDNGAAAGNAAQWELILTVDANLYGTPNPDAPVGQPPRKFRLFDRETMIGRAGTEIRVQVPVHGDPGVSRRQALLIQGPDGSLLLRDLNSANGTRVDGVNVLPGVDTLLHDGAAIAVGAWTSIIIRAIGPGCTPGITA